MSFASLSPELQGAFVLLVALVVVLALQAMPRIEAAHLRRRDERLAREARERTALEARRTDEAGA